MNYGSPDSRGLRIGFTVETIGLDVNGNTKHRLSFYKETQKGVLGNCYKKIVTNEYLGQSSPDKIIQIFGQKSC